MIVLVIGLIIVQLIFGAVGSKDSSISWGLNGMTESRCIEGYKFVIDQDGRTRQILDEFGKGVRCGNPAPGKMGSFGDLK